MTTWDKAAWDERNQKVIDEFRANSGRLRDGDVVLLTTTGARTGRQHTTPLMYLAEADRIYVIASKGGSPSHPAWYHNLVANAGVTVEVGPDRYQATARVLEGDERDRVYAALAARYPFFADYERATERKIPVVALERAAP